LNLLLELAGRAPLSQRAVRTETGCGALGQTRPTRRLRFSGFTLIEIMLVVGILGIVMTMGLPTIYRLTKKEDLRKAVSDIVEVCSNARAQAILRGTTVTLHIRPQEGRFDISAAPPVRSSGEEPDSPPTTPAAGPRSGLTAQISDHLAFEMVDVNFVEHKDDEEAKVRFFSDGTCDEMIIILRSSKNEYRKIQLEITTSLTMVDTVGTR
jgi:prepilin-type N-terminal cleavage/methylation domain-containing protein